MISSKKSGEKHPQIDESRDERKTEEKAPKITKKEKRERHIQALRNHAESSIHTKEVHTRSSLLPDHPSPRTGQGARSSARFGFLTIRHSNFLFVLAQGGANCASPRTGQGAEGGRVRPHPAALVEGVAGGGKHGSGGRELAGRS
jgi:hypothetical protein